jgi:hypothetical protein
MKGSVKSRSQREEINKVSAVLATVRVKRNLSNIQIVMMMPQPLQIPLSRRRSLLQAMKATPPPREEIAIYETDKVWLVAEELPIFDKRMTRA